MKEIIVNDKMQKNYIYFLEEPIGKRFQCGFSPELTPKEMLELGEWLKKGWAAFRRHIGTIKKTVNPIWLQLP